MRRLFGVPIGSLAVGLVLVVGVCIAIVAALALHNRVFLKIGVRNLTRRRAGPATIVLGLMLGTAIIASALGTGDTVGTTIRSSVLTSLGRIDELVSVKGVDAKAVTAAPTRASDIAYFPEADLDKVAAAVRA